MRYTYQYFRNGVACEHHADTLAELLERVFADLDQERALPAGIKYEDGKQLYNAQDLSDLWIERAELNYWAV